MVGCWPLRLLVLAIYPIRPNNIIPPTVNIIPILCIPEVRSPSNTRAQVIVINGWAATTGVTIVIGEINIAMKKHIIPVASKNAAPATYFKFSFIENLSDMPRHLINANRNSELKI